MNPYKKALELLQPSENYYRDTLRLIDNASGYHMRLFRCRRLILCAAFASVILIASAVAYLRLHPGKNIDSPTAVADINPGEISSNVPNNDEVSQSAASHINESPDIARLLKYINYTLDVDTDRPCSISWDYPESVSVDHIRSVLIVYHMTGQSDYLAVEPTTRSVRVNRSGNYSVLMMLDNDTFEDITPYAYWGYIISE